MRLIDHLCDRHTAAALTRWPVAGDLGTLLDQCSACSDIAGRLHPTGSYSIRCLPTLDNRTYEHSDAIHEAAHAVLGLAAGMPLEYAMVEPRTDAIQVGARSHVRWGEYRTELTEWAAMVWAGQQAQRRWFTARGLDDDANMIDVSNQGAHDVKLILDAAAQHGVAEDIGWDLCGERLDEHWPSIERVADSLVARGRLSGAELADLVAVPCPL